MNPNTSAVGAKLLYAKATKGGGQLVAAPVNPGQTAVARRLNAAQVRLAAGVRSSRKRDTRPKRADSNNARDTQFIRLGYGLYTTASRAASSRIFRLDVWRIPVWKQDFNRICRKNGDSEGGGRRQRRMRAYMMRRGRYWRASARCGVSISASPARSAMVRASLRIR